MVNEVAFQDAKNITGADEACHRAKLAVEGTADWRRQRALSILEVIAPGCSLARGRGGTWTSDGRRWGVSALSMTVSAGSWAWNMRIFKRTVAVTGVLPTRAYLYCGSLRHGPDLTTFDRSQETLRGNRTKVTAEEHQTKHRHPASPTTSPQSCTYSGAQPAKETQPPTQSRQSASGDQTTASWDAYIRHIVDTAPLPTPAQLERLAHLLPTPAIPDSSDHPTE